MKQFLWCVFRGKWWFEWMPEKKRRLIGPMYAWYDGPNYALGFYWFTVALSAY